MRTFRILVVGHFDLRLLQLKSLWNSVISDSHDPERLQIQTISRKVRDGILERGEVNIEESGKFGRIRLHGLRQPVDTSRSVANVKIVKINCAYLG